MHLQFAAAAAAKLSPFLSTHTEGPWFIFPDSSSFSFQSHTKGHAHYGPHMGAAGCSLRREAHQQQGPTCTCGSIERDAKRNALYCASMRNATAPGEENIKKCRRLSKFREIKNCTIFQFPLKCFKVLVLLVRLNKNLIIHYSIISIYISIICSFSMRLLKNAVECYVPLCGLLLMYALASSYNFRCKVTAIIKGAFKKSNRKIKFVDAACMCVRFCHLFAFSISTWWPKDLFISTWRIFSSSHHIRSWLGMGPRLSLKHTGGPLRTSLHKFYTRRVNTDLRVFFLIKSER